jgi:hypothetical protein
MRWFLGLMGEYLQYLGPIFNVVCGFPLWGQSPAVQARGSRGVVQGELRQKRPMIQRFGRWRCAQYNIPPQTAVNRSNGSRGWYALSKLVTLGSTARAWKPSRRSERITQSTSQGSQRYNYLAHPVGPGYLHHVQGARPIWRTARQ